MELYLKPLSYTGIPIRISDFMILGTEKTCHLPILSIEMDDRHARFEQKNDIWHIKDLRSRVGTLVNGEKIQEIKAVQQGDIITLGDVEFQITGPKEKSTFSVQSKNQKWNEQLQRLTTGSRSHHPILMLGASGTGKEVIAKSIHQNSIRKDGPMISINCSALTESLIESELFGHIKGSFTGAIADRKGAFESARGGTLFLDEIGDLPLPMQAKLLRALENNEIRPVGSDRSVTTDVRILAATHKNLKEKIKHGLFRLDLYYRLNVINILLPDLKDRMEDFETLLGEFSKTFRVRFSFGAIEKMKTHTWPGNIRELKNSIIRASALFPNQIISEDQLEDLYDFDETPDFWDKSAGAAKRWPVVKEFERQMIIQRLVHHRGNQKLAAKDLGIPKSTLHDRIKSYEIDLSLIKQRSV